MRKRDDDTAPEPAQPTITGDEALARFHTIYTQLILLWSSTTDYASKQELNELVAALRRCYGTYRTGLDMPAGFSPAPPNPYTA